MKEAEFNDSAQNQVIIEGIFEEKGITAEMDLNNAVVKIILYNNGVFEHFITYYCTLYIKYDLNFKMHLKPETIKYNQTIINRYSKTCRVSFGDNKCKIDKSLYSGVYKIKEILKESLRIESLDKENGYYNGGQIIFCDNNFSSKVLSNFGNLFILEDIIPDYAKDAREVKIISGCDKNFITCCNKFNNAINFRGEPLIPEKDFINSHLNIIMKQSFIKVIFNELKTIFKTSNNIEQKKEVALFDYFEVVRDNLAYTFQKIIREYERD